MTAIRFLLFYAILLGALGTMLGWYVLNQLLHMVLHFAAGVLT